MISAVHMKEVRRKVNAAYFADGLWDILLGLFLMLLMGSIGDWPIFIPPFFMSLLLYFIGYFVLKKIRQKVTYPRTGYIKINSKSEQRIMPLLGFIIISWFIILMALEWLITRYYVTDPFWGTGWLRLLPALAIPLVIAIVARHFKVKRWYWYAGLCLLGYVLAGWLGLDSVYSVVYAFVIPGAIIMLVGLVIFVRFLRNNPVVIPEDSTQ